MKRIREHFLSNQLLYKMFGSFALLSIVMLSLMTTLLYKAFQSSLCGEIFSAQKQNLQQITNAMDFRAEYAKYLMQSVREDKNISSLFYETNGQDMLDSLNALSNFRLSVRQLHSVYVYNEYNNKVYCSSGMTPYSSCSLDQFEDEEFVSILQTIDQYSKFSPYLRRIVQEKPNGQMVEEYVYTYLLFDTYSSGAIKNILAFNFYLDWMGEAMDYVRSGVDSSVIWAVTPDRNIVYSDNGKLIGTQVSEEVLPDSVYRNAAGYEIIGSGNNKKMLVYATPKYNADQPWTFVAWVDYSSLMKPLHQMNLLIWGIGLGFILVYLFMIALLSGKLYVPVKRTIDRVEGLVAEQRKKQEMERHILLRRLFQGELPESASKVGELLQQKGMTVDTERDRRVCLIALDHLAAYMRRHRKELHQKDALIGQWIHEQFDAAFPGYLMVRMQEGIWAVAIPTEDAEMDIQNIQRVFVGLNENLATQELTASLVISGTGHSISDVPFLYAEARSMLSFRFVLGQNNLITPQTTEDLGGGKYVYPIETEHRLVSALFSGKEQEAQKAYQEFAQQIRLFDVYDMRLAFMILANAIKRGSNETITEVSSVLLEMEKFYQKIQTLETVSEVNHLFHNLIGEIAEKTQDYALQKHKQIVQRMKDYVAENYGCISLSMNEVADYVDMSSAYLGRLFKQVTGETFTEYLTRYRLDKACEILRTTEKTVNKISEEVGFTNSSYFYIVFKKNMGCTPSQYRQKSETAE